MLRDLDFTALRFMAGQEGFFGRLSVVDSVGYWQRRFDLRPDTGIADRGALAFEGDMLLERGIGAPYVEHWWRAHDGEAIGLLLATEAGTPGCLVAVGESFIYARGRANVLPPGTTLAQLIDGAESLQAAQDLFDCEISYGRRQGHWRIERSSLYFREGACLSPAFADPDVLTVADVTPEGAPIARNWRVIAQETSLPLADWFGPCTDVQSQQRQSRRLEISGTSQ